MIISPLKYKILTYLSIHRKEDYKTLKEIAKGIDRSTYAIMGSISDLQFGHYIKSQMLSVDEKAAGSLGTFKWVIAQKGLMTLSIESTVFLVVV